MIPIDPFTASILTAHAVHVAVWSQVAKVQLTAVGTAVTMANMQRVLLTGR